MGPKMPRRKTAHLVLLDGPDSYIFDLDLTSYIIRREAYDNITIELEGVPVSEPLPKEN